MRLLCVVRAAGRRVVRRRRGSIDSTLMPLAPDVRETKVPLSRQRKRPGPYGGSEMDTTRGAWTQAVAEAAARQDTDQLGDLFAQARQIWGPQEASRMWLAAVSGFDASAVTG